MSNETQKILDYTVLENMKLMARVKALESLLINSISKENKEMAVELKNVIDSSSISFLQEILRDHPAGEDYWKGLDILS
jgi:hypothetical protein